MLVRKGEGRQCASSSVPSDPSRQEQWRQLGVETSTYRDTYRIPTSETQPVPGAPIKAGNFPPGSPRCTNTAPKRPRNPWRPPTHHSWPAAQVEAAVKKTPTPAEQVVDHVQEARGTEAQLSPAEERAERISALARKVRENRAKNQRTDADTRSPEAVKEALEQIKARRAQEQARHQTRRATSPRPGRTAGPASAVSVPARITDSERDSPFRHKGQIAIGEAISRGWGSRFEVRRKLCIASRLWSLQGHFTGHRMDMTLDISLRPL